VLFSLQAAASDHSTPGGARARIGISLPTLVAFYFIGALGIGTIIMLFGSWATTRLRATLLGFLVGTLVFMVGNFLLPDPIRGLNLPKGAVLFGLILGAPFGAMSWTRPRP